MRNLITHTFIDYLINKRCGVLSFGQALFKFLMSMHTQIIPCFLSTKTRLKTQSVRGMGYMKLALRNFSNSALIVATFLGLTD